jgi:uncharacterized membrane protein YkoI
MIDPLRFDELLRLWTDGEASAAELEEFARALRENPERRRELVRSVMVEVNLYGRYAACAGAGAGRAKPRSRAWEVAAAALVLAISVFLLGRLFLLKKPDSTVGGRQAQVPPIPPLPAPTPAVKKAGRLLDHSTLSLPQALDAALQKGTGVPVKVELGDEDGKVTWTVVFASGRKSREIDIDAATGTVLEDQLEEGDVSAVAAALKVSLRSAVEKALASVPGRPVEAEAEFRKGRLVVEVTILHEGELREIRVDGESGELLK